MSFLDSVVDLTGAYGRARMDLSYYSALCISVLACLSALSLVVQKPQERITANGNIVDFQCRKDAEGALGLTCEETVMFTDNQGNQQKANVLHTGRAFEPRANETISISYDPKDPPNTVSFGNSDLRGIGLSIMLMVVVGFCLFTVYRQFVQSNRVAASIYGGTSAFNDISNLVSGKGFRLF